MINFRYEEDNLKVGRKKTNLMFIGDGRGKTVISGSKNVYQNMTTFHTASFGKCGLNQVVWQAVFNSLWMMIDDDVVGVARGLSFYTLHAFTRFLLSKHVCTKCLLMKYDYYMFSFFH